MTDPRHWFTGTRLSRRRLLRASIATTALATGPIFAGAALRRDAAPEAVDRLAALLPAASAAAVGRAYLANAPDVAGLDGVRSALLLRIPALAEPRRVSDQDLRALLEARTRADFGVGDIARVDGWILATTETLLCAYVALLGDRAV
jgi:hypothetical protein